VPGSGRPGNIIMTEIGSGDVAAGEHLTDQLLPPFALAGAGSFTAVKVNMHSCTNRKIIAEFLPVRFELREDGF
jgi:RNA 3'-terminal phosphate cyclase (ATP)